MGLALVWHQHVCKYWFMREENRMIFILNQNIEKIVLEGRISSLNSFLSNYETDFEAIFV